MGGTAKGVVERQLIELRDNRIADFLAAEPKVRTPKTAHSVDQAVSVHVPDPAAVPAHDDVRRRVARRTGVSHRMQQMQGVFGLEFSSREFGHQGFLPIMPACAGKASAPPASESPPPNGNSRV